jgi:hypothetical protein
MNMAMSLGVTLDRMALLIAGFFSADCYSTFFYFCSAGYCTISSIFSLIALFASMES